MTLELKTQFFTSVLIVWTQDSSAPKQMSCNTTLRVVARFREITDIKPKCNDVEGAERAV